ncbi:hypothetical protein K2173_001653 [Erythroxylum novogranatense]|uniref:Uncharacterized protein n=1 Tax=Erythroxylum novogranatense TaxID=1862640 RepID=A0AAV8T4Q4_9ROSI|nr:hypothetical protein K2173_001653 [Erythroxylum novogranatense]
MGDLEKGGMIDGTRRNGAKEEEEEEVEEEEGRLMAVLDFDLLCSTVALQTQGKWTKLQTQDHDEDDYNCHFGGGGGAFRMWEGELLDCRENRRIAIESFCCPCFRFGKNMRRAGFGPCFLHGIAYYVIALVALLSFVTFVVTKRHCFLYLSLCFTISIGLYLGFYRTLTRKKFNIIGSDSFLDDCIYHLVCPCCTLSQESRTLEMNNVQDGTWHGRGDTICIGGHSVGSKAGFELSSSPLVSTKSPDNCSMQKNADALNQLTC